MEALARFHTRLILSVRQYKEKKMTPKILITAANGHTGFPAAKELLSLGFPVRAFVRNSSNPKAQELKPLGAELFVGDIVIGDVVG